MISKIYLCVSLFGLIFQLSHAQCIGPNFNLPTNACLGQNLVVTPVDVYDNYEWDFCAGDLDQTPTASVFQSSAGAAFKVELAEQDGQYFGFYTSQNNGRLYRLDFGSDINSNPTPVDLGTLGVNSNGLFTTDIVNEGGDYYGFITDLSNKILRIRFGTSLTNQPSNAEVIYHDDLLHSPVDLAVLEDGTGKYLFVANIAINTLVKLKFASSFAEVAGSITASEISITGSGGLSGISFIRECSTWYAMTTSFGSGKIAKIIFNTGLDYIDTDPPDISLITGLPFTPVSPAGISLAFENNKYYAFVQSVQTSSNLYKIDFGNSMSNAPSSSSADLGNLGVLNSTWGFVMYKVKSDWLVLSSVNGGQNIYRITFPNSCFSTIKYSTDAEPELVSINAGSYSVTLSVRDVSGLVSVQSKPINVSSNESPDISFSSQNVCANYDINFTSQNTSGNIISYAWNFGDSQMSPLANPVHQYVSSGEYSVNLNVTADITGCINTVNKILKIYDQPVASFTAPSGLICTNNEFTFVNNLVDNYDGHLSYQWLVNNNPVSEERDLKYTFPSGGDQDQDVKLHVSIPGCFNESIQPIMGILTGPTVGFSSIGQCENDLISFADESSGTITDYNWDFGNGNTLHTSTSTNPTQVYDKGSYSVSLRVTGSNECESTTSKVLPVYSKPQPDFSIELPPFSCSGTPSQFTNTTPNPTDSNIASWVWSFGDKNNSSASDKNPLYIFSEAGDYDVKLTAVSNFNCAADITKTIRIAQGPPVDFTHTPACLNKGTRFTDDSGNDIKSWFWMIGNSTYAFSNPTHVFSSIGDQNAQLTVTGNNDCIATLSKTITVPIPPTLDFSFTNACEGQETTFQDTSPFATDPVASLAWDFAGNTKNGSPVQYSFDLAGTYAVTMISTQLSGCTYSISKNVIISPSPVAKFSANPEWGTPPLNVQFTNQSTGASSYSWHFNDKNNSTSNLISPNFQFIDLGDYVVDLIATNVQGCSNTASAKISVIVPSLDLELKELNLIKDPASGLYRVMVTIKNRSNFTLNSADVIIDIAGNARIKETISTSILPDAEVSQLLANQIIPGNLFTYLCAELDYANDVDLFNNKKCETVGDKGVVFLPYPNPGNGEFQFDWISLTEEVAHFTIFNSVGQAVFEQDIPATASGLNQAHFDLRSCGSGAYFLKFNTKSLSKTIPITIVR